MAKQNQNAPSPAPILLQSGTDPKNSIVTLSQVENGFVVTKERTEFESDTISTIEEATAIYEFQIFDGQ